mmetsp:Transcript_5177/g.7297  ORF Transcript_5177/g.7297 Transcript_5177/m.7297 type:complete len:100 (+) Transcript_5177:1772-2071(+)
MDVVKKLRMVIKYENVYNALIMIYVQGVILNFRKGTLEGNIPLLQKDLDVFDDDGMSNDCYDLAGWMGESNWTRSCSIQKETIFEGTQPLNLLLNVLLS